MHTKLGRATIVYILEVKIRFNYTSTRPTHRPGMSEPIREERAAHSGATYSPTIDVQTYMYDTPVRQQLA